MPRRSSAASTEATSRPSTRTVPSVGSIMRLIMRRDVVLPQPDGPTKTVMPPASTVRSRWSTATVPSGKRLVTPRNSIIRETSVFADDPLPVAASSEAIPTDRQPATDVIGPRSDGPRTDGGSRGGQPPAAQRVAHRGRPQRPREQPALVGVHPDAAQHVELLRGLHALGDRGAAHRARHVDHG